MRVADLRISNFRGVREAHVRFASHTVLIGPSGVGKTTLIEALALLFGRGGLVRELTEHDFTGSTPRPADRIILVASVVGFDGDNPDDHLDWFRDGRGIPKFLDPGSGRIYPSRDQAGWSLCCQIGFQARFDHDTLSVETVRYFHDHDDGRDPFAGDAHVSVPPKLLEQIGFYLVRASRTWDGVISFGSELFRRTVAAAEGQPATAVIEARNQLRQPEAAIENDERLRPLINRLDAEIARFLPRSPRLKLRITATDSRSVLEDIVAHFGAGDALPIPMSRQGSGLISLQSLLLLLELGRARIASGRGFLMALEEPELHVPPPSQGRLMRRIQALSHQTIITTHAPAVAEMADPTSLLLLRSDKGSVSAEQLLREPLQNTAQGWVRRLFIHGRQKVIAALMHETVLIPEGRSDQELLRAVSCALELRQPWNQEQPPSFALEVGLIPTEDAQVVAIHSLLARLHGRICCLVDGDAAGDGYTAALRDHLPPPASILRWPDGWAIENVIEWILAGNEGAVLGRLGSLEGPPSSITEVGDLIRRSRPNNIVNEVVAEAIAETPTCAARARDLLTAIAIACAGAETTRFVTHPTGAMVFVP